MSIEITTATHETLSSIRQALEESYNTAQSLSSTVPFIGNNSASGVFSVILGGNNNTASGAYSVIVGGENNDSDNQTNTFILGSNITAGSPNYTYVNNLSTNGIVETANGNSIIWQSTFNTVSSLSANWQSTFDTVSSLSANWQSTFDTVSSLSASWTEAYTSWNSTSATSIVEFNDTRFSKLSSRAYTLIDEINSVQPTVGSNTASGNYSFVAGGSANDTRGFDNTFILGTALSASAANFTYVNNLSSQGVISSTSLNTSSISSRFINLEHSTPNDGINPVLFIGERGDGSGGTIINSLSGFNTTYEEANNRLNISTQFGTVTSTAVTITSSCNVGIGTTTPNQTLTVIGSISASNSITTPTVSANVIIGQSNETVLTDGSDLLGNGTNTLSLNYISGVYVNRNLIVVGTNSSTNVATFALSSRSINLEHSTPNDGINPVLFIGERGDGITGGTVAGSLSGFNTTYDEANNRLNISTQFGTVTSTAVTITSSCNVGIGTQVPNQTLTVVGTTSSTNIATVSLSSRFINLEHSTPNDGINPVLFIGERGDGIGGTVAGSLSGFNTTYEEANNRLNISTQFGTVTSTAVTITSSGNIGIGTTAPNFKLTVVGDISATGNVYGNSYINIQSGTNYTIDNSDAGGIVGSTNATTGLTASISNTNYPTGFQLSLIQLGTARVTVSAGPGVTLNQADGFYRTLKQYSAATLVNTGATGWVLFGSLSS
jgi:hypothetical protein